MSITTILQQTSFQVASGSIIGGLVDNLFPVASTVDKTNVLRTIGEVVLQITLDALLVSYANESITNSVRGTDPTGGIPMMTAVIGTQPHLINKLSSISNFTGSLFRNFYMGQVSSVGVQSPNRAGYITLATSPQSAANEFGSEDSTTPHWSELHG